LKLVGTSSNRDAIGSVVTVLGSPPQVRQVKGGGGYQSTRDPRLFFAVDGGSLVSLSIRWPNGRETTVEGLAAGGSYIVIEPDSGNSPQVLPLQEPQQ
jgi:hypothetical protein